MRKETQDNTIYYARRELGLCVICGMDVDDPSLYDLCAECRNAQGTQDSPEKDREWRRNYQRNYRQDIKNTLHRIALAAQKLSEVTELKTTRTGIPYDHKCWNCVWSRWHDDRFFCPLVGCVKGPMKREATIEDKVSEY